MQRRAVTAVVCLLSLAVLFGCNTAEQPAATPDTRAADEAAIRKADADWVKAAQTKQVDAWLAFYADDAAVMPPNEKTMSKTDANLHKDLADMFGLPNMNITWEPTKVIVAKSGDIGYLHGTYHVTFNDPKGKPAREDGKMVEVWKKQADGGWKCAVDMWSPDTAPAPPSK